MNLHIYTSTNPMKLEVNSSINPSMMLRRFEQMIIKRQNVHGKLTLEFHMGVKV